MESNFLQPDGAPVDPEESGFSSGQKNQRTIQVDFSSIIERERVEAELVKLRKAVETSGEVVFLTDREGTITYVNPEFTRLYGYEAEEVMGRTTPRILKSGMMMAQDYEQFWEALLTKQVVKREFINKCKDGRLVTVEGSANPILDEHENIVGFLAIQRDITQRLQAEERIRQRNKELAALNAIATTVSQSLNLNQIFNDALDEVLQLDMFGGSAKGMLFRLDKEKGGFSLIAHRGAPQDHPCLIRPPQLGECLCGLAARQREAIISEDCRRDQRHERQWPEMPEHKDICLPLKVRGEVLGVMNVRLPATHVIATHDVKFLTSVADQIGVAIVNARLFETVSQQHERLRTLSSRLAEAEETERRRLAQELHDQVGQKLTALSVNLNIIRDATGEEEQQIVFSKLAETQDLLEQMTQLIRGVMSDLHPPMLDDLGLVETLHWYGDQFSSRSGISVIVNSDKSDLHLPTHIEIALFRIVQEALTNVVKHARATEVKIIVEGSDNTVRLIVADNGVGFSPDRLTNPVEDHGWGLLIMAERARVVGGSCWIESHPSEGGARVTVEIPQ